MLKRLAHSTAVAAAVGAAPLAAGGLRAVVTHGAIWLWGDQAVIDIEARNTLTGRNLLGVYDRYGWHHPGPLWLALLGVFRWLGGGSAIALVFGSYVLQACAAASIVAVAARLRPGLTAWWAALLVVAYEWDFGPQRLGVVWAPYAVALPAALVVLLAAYLVSNPRSWQAALGLVVCASFLVQTDLSTTVVVLAVVLVTAVACALNRGKLAWGPGRGWRLRVGILLGTALVIWLPPLVQQATVRQGNLELVARFFLSHHAQRSWHFAFRALGTVFGAVPLPQGRHGTSLDADLTWLAAEPALRRPWYAIYLAGTCAAVLRGIARRRPEAVALGGLCLVGLVAAGFSVKLAFGPPFPYLFIWVGALAVPAWAAAWLAFAPATSPAWLRSSLPFAAALGGAAVVASFATGVFPMAGTASLLGQRSWEAVGSQVLEPRVTSVLVDIDGRDAMPEGAAIVDAALRHGRKVEVDRAAVYFFDSSLAPRQPAQLKVVVCCGNGDPSSLPRGVTWRGRVGGQSIYSALLPGRTGAMRRGSAFARVLRWRHRADPWRLLRPD